MIRSYCRLGLLLLAAGCTPHSDDAPADDSAVDDTVVVRVMTYNIEDVRSVDVRDPENARLRRAAALIQHIRPDILLINEMTYDQPGGPDVIAGALPGLNAERFATNFLSLPQSDSLEPLLYRTLMLPTNTGEASGFDLDNDGLANDSFPLPPPPNADGTPSAQTPEGRAYGNDAWGFGTYPGQYGFALLISENLLFAEDQIRTFRLLPWSAMPEARLPVDSVSGQPWFSDSVAAVFRLSSKSHIDVPVRLRNGVVLHILASHPTPPAFDGPERRNILRNEAEIRFWADYLDGADYLRDDSSRNGGLDARSPFVLLGDLNADPDEGNALDDPITRWLLNHPRIDGSFVPVADSAGLAAYPDLDPDDTAQWGLRVDYVLPSRGLRVVEGGIVRPDPAELPPSDHFPVWLDIAVPPQE